MLQKNSQASLKIQKPLFENHGFNLFNSLHWMNIQPFAKDLASSECSINFFEVDEFVMSGDRSWAKSATRAGTKLWPWAVGFRKEPQESIKQEFDEAIKSPRMG